ncbi:MAG: PatB family C-S lyase [Pseudomonadota bacterium]
MDFGPEYFDRIIDRTESHSTKWQKFPPEVLPLWVADMDFAAPDFILDALKARLEHPILGYTDRPESLNGAFRGWLEHQFDWRVPADWIVWLPGVVPGINLTVQTLAPGSRASILVPTPVYYPFLEVAEHAEVDEIRVPMQPGNQSSGNALSDEGYWQMDAQALQAACRPDTRMLLLSNPQNPTGRCFLNAELDKLATLVAQQDLILISDEIHCSLILDPTATHTIFAQAYPELAARTVTLFAATKVYNIPGVSCAAAIIPDAQLREAFLTARRGILPGIGPLGFCASEAAFADRSNYVPALLAYLRDNLALVREYLGSRVAPLQATYLAWLDVRDLHLDDPQAFFASHGVGLNDGAQFGAPGYVRLNFGCPRQTLRTALTRLSNVLA